MKKKKMIIIFIISTFTISFTYLFMYIDTLSIRKQLENKFGYKISHIFTLHNFNNGTYWFVYNDTAIYGREEWVNNTLDSPVKLTIKKVKGKWIITDWKEKYI